MPFRLKPCLLYILLSLFTFPLLFTSIATGAEQESDENTVNEVVTTVFELSFELESLGHLSDLTGIELPPTGPVSLHADLNVTNQGYTVSNIRFIAGKSDISGDITVTYSSERPALTARLESNLIDLTEFYVNEREKQEEENNKIETGDVEKVFSTRPLPFDFIRNYDMDITYSAKTILSHHIELDNFRFGAIQSNGNLDIHTLNADVANGQLVASGSINAANAPLLVSVKMDITRLEPGLLPDIKALNAIDGLPTDLTFIASGTGNNIADIMGSLNGSFLSQSGKGMNYIKQLNQLGINFLTEALNILNPLRKKKDENKINCIVFKFDMRDGEAVSDRGIGGQTQDLNVIGGGAIDFKKEQFDFLLHPEARSGITIGTINLVDAVRISGRFSDPVVNAETQAALLKRAGTVGTVLFTGGLSYLAQKLFEKTQFKDDPCGEALGGTAPATNSDENNIKPEGATTQ